jgi:GGDEF domain-containing protein
LRLTVIFHDDEGLGYLLTLFDVAMTLPLVVWGDTPWLAAPLVALWVAGLSFSARLSRGRRGAGLAQGDHLIDSSTGLLNPGRFPAAVQEEARLAAVRDKPFSLVVVRVRRFTELQAYCGPHAAERSMGVVARRALRAAGAGAEGYRLAEDRLALLLPGCEAVVAAELAVAISRAVSGRLLDGRKVDCEVGYATGPRDGCDARELLAAAVAPVYASAPVTEPSAGSRTAVTGGFSRPVADRAAV